MLARLFYSVTAVTGGAVLSQFPEYYTHYVQRLGGRIDQARLRAEAIREDAAAKGLSVEDYIQTFLDSEPHALEGGRMAESIFELGRMESAYHALREAPLLERPFAFAEHMNTRLVDATMGDFAPALPLTPEGFIYAAVGALAALGVVLGARSIVRRRRRGRRQKELQV